MEAKARLRETTRTLPLGRNPDRSIIVRSRPHILRMCWRNVTANPIKAAMVTRRAEPPPSMHASTSLVFADWLGQTIFGLLFSASLSTE
jgi:hypothetical protein